MNCRKCQEEIVELLAAGAATHPTKVTTHRQACPACGEFYEEQAKLFRSVEAGLHSMVNQAVPPSLVPGLRARLDQLSPARPVWIRRCGFAIPLAAATVLALSVGYSFYGQGGHLNPSESGAVFSPKVLTRGPAGQTPLESAAISPNRSDLRKSVIAATPRASEVVPKVVIPAEERQAFAALVNQLPSQREVASALTQPAPVAPDVTVEIALLQIEQMEVKPLEGTPAE